MVGGETKVQNRRGQDLLKHMSGCNAKLVSDIPSKGRITRTSIAVKGYGPDVDAGSPTVLVTVVNGLMLDCHFAPLLRNGAPTYYQDALLVAH
jgi:hypothetical protein